jgi:hypothetical protein
MGHERILANVKEAVGLKTDHSRSTVVGGIYSRLDRSKNERSRNRGPWLIRRMAKHSGMFDGYVFFNSLIFLFKIIFFYVFKLF